MNTENLPMILNAKRRAKAPATATKTGLQTAANVQDLDPMERLERAIRRARGTMAPHTFRSYRNGARNYAAWCDELITEETLTEEMTDQGKTIGEPKADYGFPYTEIDPIDVANFIDERAKTLKPATVANYAIGINHQCVLMEMPQPSSALIVQQALIRMRRENTTEQKAAKPIGLAQINAAMLNMGDDLRSLRDCALIWVAYDGMCRASELVDMRVKHIGLSPTQAGKFSIYIKRSKGDQTGKGAYQYCDPVTYEAVQTWVKAAGLTEDDFLFRSVCNSSRKDYLITNDVSLILKRRIGKEFTAHSIRIGAAIDQLNDNQSMPRILSSGRWKSAAMVLKYIAQSEAQTSGSAMMAQKQLRAGRGLRVRDHATPPPG